MKCRHGETQIRHPADPGVGDDGNRLPSVDDALAWSPQCGVHGIPVAGYEVSIVDGKGNPVTPGQSGGTRGPRRSRVVGDPGVL